MSRLVMRAALLTATLSALVSAGLRPAQAQQPELAEEEIQDRFSADPPAPATSEPIPAGPMAGGRSATPPPPAARPPLPLFYNYYVGPPGVPAQMYPCPRPTPEYVGRVWITYPPFMPNEYLYHHSRRYYHYTPGGYSSASVRYSSGIMGLIPAF